MEEVKKLRLSGTCLDPQLVYNINPSYEQYYDSYQNPNALDENIEYSPFEQSLYGAPSKVRSSNVGITLSNTFEAKVRDQDTTAVKTKKNNAS